MQELKKQEQHVWRSRAGSQGGWCSWRLVLLWLVVIQGGGSPLTYCCTLMDFFLLKPLDKSMRRRNPIQATCVSVDSDPQKDSLRE